MANLIPHRLGYDQPGGFDRIAMTTAMAFSLASPALADCRKELSKLEQPSETAEPASALTSRAHPPHQEEVLPGKQGTSGETTGATSGKVGALTPPQKQVTGTASDKNADVSQLLADARKLADIGEEEACLRKVSELKNPHGCKLTRVRLAPRVRGAS